MKKTMILAATVFFAFGANAQMKAHFGVKAGMNASELHVKNAETKMDTKIGFHAGVLAHMHKDGSQFAFQPEVIYSIEGAKNIGSTKYQQDLHFINVPLLAQYMFDNGFRIEAGPQVGFLVAAKVKDGDSNKDSFKSTNISIPVGIGYLTKSGLGFDARYSFGVTDLRDVKGADKLTGNNFQFGIFWQFSDPKVK